MGMTEVKCRIEVSMTSVGIIVNPFSGKDVRRVTTNASIVTNQEKVNKVYRMILSMNAFHIDQVWLMPDKFSVNASIVEKVKANDRIKIKVDTLPFEPYGNYLDTMHAAEEMEAAGAGCIIVLGGDGTSRLLARSQIQIPVLPISTGTNNAFPEFWEGTTAGIAASFVALYPEEAVVSPRNKAIRIVKNGKKEELAIVDLAISSLSNIGTKVIKDFEDIREIVVCHSAPHLIGFSSAIGSIATCKQEDDFGYRIRLIEGGRGQIAPVNSGELTEFGYDVFEKMPLGLVYEYRCTFDGSVALDGERTMTFSQGDLLEISIERAGLRQVAVVESLEAAIRKGFMKVMNDD